MRLRIQLEDRANISLQRKNLMPWSESEYQQPIFCNVSTTAHAAVVFLKQKLGDCIETKLLKAKTRVAPIKSVCVPRLDF